MSNRSWASGYQLVFGIIVTLLLTFGAARSTVPDILAEAEQRGCSALGVLAALMCFATAIWSAGWYFAGPLAISSERLQWTVWHRNPSDWLSGDKRRTLTIGAILAVTIASLAALALGGVMGSPALLFGLALTTVLQSLVILALKLQHLDLDAVARSVPAVFGLTGVGLSALQAWGILAAVTVLCCLFGVLVASNPRWLRIVSGSRSGRERNELTPRWQLHRVARNRWSVRGSIAMVDPDFVRVIGQRDARASGRPLPAFLYRSGWPINLALVVFARTLRPAAIAVAFALPFAFAVHELLGPLAAVSVLAPLEFLITITMTRSAQAWLSHRALRRTWATDDIRTPIALAAPGMVFCSGITLIAVVGLTLPLPVGLLLLALPATVMGRRQRASRPAAHLTLMSTPAGPVPLQVMDRAIAGPDVVVAVLVMASMLL